MSSEAEWSVVMHDDYEAMKMREVVKRSWIEEDVYVMNMGAKARIVTQPESRAPVKLPSRLINGI